MTAQQTLAKYSSRVKLNLAKTQLLIATWANVTEQDGSAASPVSLSLFPPPFTASNGDWSR